MIPAHSLRRGSLYSVSAAVFGKILGFASTLYIANRFGASIQTDMIWFCASLLTWLSSIPSIFFANLLSPLFIALKESDQEKVAWKVYFKWTGTGAFLLLLPFLFFIFFPVITLELLSSFPKEKIVLYQNLFLYLLPILILGFINDALIHLIQANRNFLLTNLTSPILGVFLISFVFFFSEQFGPVTISIALTLAKLTETLILGSWLFYHLQKSDSNEKNIVLAQLPQNSLSPKNFIPILLIHLIQIPANFMPEFLWSSFPGGLTAWINAKKIYELIPTLIIYPIVTVFYPVICQKILKNQERELVFSLIRTLFTLVIPGCCLIFFHAKSLSLFLFHHGSYTKEAATLSADCLQWIVIAIPFLVIQSVTSRLIAARQDLSLWWKYAGTQTLSSMIFLASAPFFTATYGKTSIPAWFGLSQILILLPGNLWILKIIYKNIEKEFYPLLFLFLPLSVHSLLSFSTQNETFLFVLSLAFWALWIAKNKAFQKGISEMMQIRKEDF